MTAPPLVAILLSCLVPGVMRSAPGTETGVATGAEIFLVVLEAITAPTPEACWVARVQVMTRTKRANELVRRNIWKGSP